MSSQRLLGALSATQATPNVHSASTLSRCLCWQLSCPRRGPRSVTVPTVSVTTTSHTGRAGGMQLAMQQLVIMVRLPFRIFTVFGFIGPRRRGLVNGLRKRHMTP